LLAGAVAVTMATGIRRVARRFECRRYLPIRQESGRKDVRADRQRFRLAALGGRVADRSCDGGPGRDCFGGGGKSAHAAKAKPASEAPPPSADLVAAKQAYEEACAPSIWASGTKPSRDSRSPTSCRATLPCCSMWRRRNARPATSRKPSLRTRHFCGKRPATPNREMIEAKIRDLETAAEAKTAAQKPGASPAQPDRLTGIWEDPFERKPWAPAVSESPATPVVAAPAALPPASASPVLPEPSVPPAASAGGGASASGRASAGLSPPLTAALDLGQKPAGEESAVVSRSGSRWWLWTGIGVVVVGGVVTAILLRPAVLGAMARARRGWMAAFRWGSDRHG